MFAKSLSPRIPIHLFLLAGSIGLGLALCPSGNVLLLLTITLIDLIFRWGLRAWKPEILRLNRSIMPSLIFAYSAIILVGPLFIPIHLFVIALSDSQRQRYSGSEGQRPILKIFFPAISWLVGASLTALFSGLGDFSAPVLPFAFGLMAVGGIAANDLVVNLLFRLSSVGKESRSLKAGPGGPWDWVTRYISAGFGITLICSSVIWDGPLGLAALAILIALLSLTSLSVSAGVSDAIAAAAQAVDDEIVRSESLNQKASRVEALAYVDALTGLPNRRRFEADLVDLPTDGFIALGDVSGLKAINDHRGHPTGDDLLRAIAQALEDVTNEYGGRAYRFTGGDEYAILSPEITTEAAKFLPLRLDDLIAHHISTFPSLDGSRAHLRLGWSQRTAQEAPHQARRRAEMLLTERGISERPLRLAGSL